MTNSRRSRNLPRSLALELQGKLLTGTSSPMSGKSRDPSRRRVIGGIGAGLSAAGLGAKQASAKGERSMKGLKDPVSEYPRPPFPKQQQEWPGLVSKMTPRPDHGETS